MIERPEFWVVVAAIFWAALCTIYENRKNARRAREMEKQAAIKELWAAADGLALGIEWGIETRYKDHRYRQRLLDALAKCRALGVGD